MISATARFHQRDAVRPNAVTGPSVSRSPKSCRSPVEARRSQAAEHRSRAAAARIPGAEEEAEHPTGP